MKRGKLAFFMASKWLLYISDNAFNFSYLVTGWYGDVPTRFCLDLSAGVIVWASKSTTKRLTSKTCSKKASDSSSCPQIIQLPNLDSFLPQNGISHTDMKIEV